MKFPSLFFQFHVTAKWITKLKSSKNVLDLRYVHKYLVSDISIFIDVVFECSSLWETVCQSGPISLSFAELASRGLVHEAALDQLLKSTDHSRPNSLPSTSVLSWLISLWISCISNTTRIPTIANVYYVNSIAYICFSTFMAKSCMDNYLWPFPR